jgi:hypothetical protein
MNLIEAVHHLCQAGDYDLALKPIVWEKIYLEEGGNRILVNRFGAWETALELMKEFFSDGDITQSPLLSIPN